MRTLLPHEKNIEELWNMLLTSEHLAICCKWYPPSSLLIENLEYNIFERYHTNCTTTRWQTLINFASIIFYEFKFNFFGYCHFALTQSIFCNPLPYNWDCYVAFWRKKKSAQKVSHDRIETTETKSDWTVKSKWQSYQQYLEITINSQWKLILHMRLLCLYQGYNRLMQE